VTPPDVNPPTQTQPPPRPADCPEADDPTDTDAWFSAFAPAGEPKIAVGVLVVAAGAGGDTAAPMARTVMLAALR
jgi:cell division protein FtsI/penicillin-binding protein 2